MLRQVEALGGTERDCEVLYNAFRDLVKAAKKTSRRARPAAASSAVARRMDADAALLRENRKRATAADRFGGGATSELDALAAKHSALDLAPGDGGG